MVIYVLSLGTEQTRAPRGSVGLDTMDAAAELRRNGASASTFAS